MQSQKRKKQAHVDFGIHSVGKEVCCVSNNFTALLYRGDYSPP